MPLVPLRPVLDAAVKYGYAQGAFNVNAVAQAEAGAQVPFSTKATVRFWKLRSVR